MTHLHVVVCVGSCELQGGLWLRTFCPGTKISKTVGFYGLRAPKVGVPGLDNPEPKLAPGETAPYGSPNVKNGLTLDAFRCLSSQSPARAYDEARYSRLASHQDPAGS